MNEDDIYRSSSQYRYWSFTPEALASLRSSTNSAAAARVRAAIKRSRNKTTEQQNGNGAPNGTAKGRTNGHEAESDVDCLTVEEEAKLVQFYCTLCLQMSDSFDFPVPMNVKATAVQFIKRFYLTNSPMTYHPKQIMPAALFLATKTENYYVPLAKYAKGIRKTSEADILAPEFLITQALRFTFDVRHPHRALKGVLMELTGLAAGDTGMLLPGNNQEFASSSSALRNAIASLPRPSKDIPTAIDARLARAYDVAKNTLAGAALLTDAYFLYTPAQIGLAALRSADRVLTDWYLGTKFAGATLATTSSSNDAATSGPKFIDPPAALSKLLATLDALAQLLGAYRSGGEAREECVRIDRKLYRCRNPEKVDLVGLNRAVKREGKSSAGAEGGEGVTESAAKRRKLEREKREDDDVFGGDLKR
ncbi:MAG: hypothetical protein M1821_009033 [Bathelium mastoideum]|nr:MAG: hypothetical protein M1821_009033 [Bathelium mastoideum]KAI9684264.1 MAG: hypothetical protein M1822_005737 [Bathelium mastoideum]